MILTLNQGLQVTNQLLIINTIKLTTLVNYAWVKKVAFFNFTNFKGLGYAIGQYIIF